MHISTSSSAAVENSFENNHLDKLLFLNLGNAENIHVPIQNTAWFYLLHIARAQAGCPLCLTEDQREEQLHNVILLMLLIP